MAALNAMEKQDGFPGEIKNPARVNLQEPDTLLCIGKGFHGKKYYS